MEPVKRNATNPAVEHLMGYGGPPLGNVQLNGRFKNKFENGFFSGSSDSQFHQAGGRTLPILPYNTNRDLEWRLAASKGDNVAGVPLMPSWERSYAFAPGLGLDAKASRITHTPASAGLLSTYTGLAAPLLSAGQDKITEGPIPATWNPVSQGLGAMLNAPAVRAGGPMKQQPQRKSGGEKAPPMEVRVVK